LYRKNVHMCYGLLWHKEPIKSIVTRGIEKKLQGHNNGQN